MIHLTVVMLLQNTIVLCFVMCYYQSLAHNLIISLLCQKIFVKAIKIILICQYLCKSQQHQNRSRNKKE